MHRIRASAWLAAFLLSVAVPVVSSLADNEQECKPKGEQDPQQKCKESDSATNPTTPSPDTLPAPPVVPAEGKTPPLFPNPPKETPPTS